jgi:hypothetical protein
MHTVIVPKNMMVVRREIPSNSHNLRVGKVLELCVELCDVDPEVEIRVEHDETLKGEDAVQKGGDHEEVGRVLASLQSKIHIAIEHWTIVCINLVRFICRASACTI